MIANTTSGWERNGGIHGGLQIGQYTLVHQISLLSSKTLLDLGWGVNFDECGGWGQLKEAGALKSTIECWVPKSCGVGGIVPREGDK